MMEDIILVIIGIVAVILNVLLIIVTLRINNRNEEIQIILGLSAIDSLLPLVAIITGLAHILGEKKLLGFIPCSVKGPFDFGLIVISVSMVSIIALQRYIRVSGKTVSKLAWITIFTTIFGYTFLLIIAAANGEFQTSLGGVDCTPQPQKSNFSVLVLFLFGFILLAFFLITLVCYLKIILMVTNLSHREDIIEMKSNNEVASTPLPGLNQRPVLIRTISICTIYGLLIIPASFLIMIEATTTNIPKPPSYSVAISILVSSIAVANPALVLFAHAIIYKSLTNTLSSLFNPNYRQSQHTRL